jgi:hypothetical protein
VTQLVSSLSDNDALNKVPYFYVMSAYNSFGEGQRSEEFGPIIAYQPVSATNASLSLVVAGKKNVSLSWFAALPEAETSESYRIQRYQVNRSADNGASFVPLSSVTHVLGQQAFSYLDSSTDFGGNYIYQVIPYDNAGNPGISYQVATVSIPGPFNNILIFKNSFNPDRGETVPVQFSLVTGGRVWVRAYTLQGEYVATIFDEEVSGQVDENNPYLSDKKDWDGKNSAGQTVASGVYILHLQAPGFRTNARVAVIK